MQVIEIRSNPRLHRAGRSWAARSSAGGITANPDLAVAIDTTLCVDLPGVPEDERTSKQGDGVALTIMDSSAIGNRPLIDSFEAVAKKHKIPHQLSILFRGGTDAGQSSAPGAVIQR